MIDEVCYTHLNAILCAFTVALIGLITGWFLRILIKEKK